MFHVVKVQVLSEHITVVSHNVSMIDILFTNAFFWDILNAHLANVDIRTTGNHSGKADTIIAIDKSSIPIRYSLSNVGDLVSITNPVNIAIITANIAIYLTILFIFFCNGNSFSAADIMDDILPNSVFIHVLITSATQCQLTTKVHIYMICSDGETSSWLLIDFFSISLDSPVSIDSFILSECASTTIASADILSHIESMMISQGTRFLDSISISLPSLMTVDSGSIMLLSALIAVSALYS
jgi:hypothetical protein